MHGWKEQPAPAGTRSGRPRRVLAALLCLLAAGSAAQEPEDVPGVSGASLSAPFRPEASGVTIALLDTLVNPWDGFLLNETLDAIRRAMPETAIRTITLSEVEAGRQIARTKPDFLFAPAGFSFGSGPDGTAGVETVRIATRRTRLAERAEESVGAAVVVRRESPARTIADLAGARIHAGLPSALDGWLALARELHAGGRDPDRFFSSVAFRNNPYPDALSAVLSGAADAAVLPACLLEAVRREGLVDASSLRVVDARAGRLACAHSTRLYPDVSLLALSTAPESAVRAMTVALLTMEGPRDLEWLTNVSHAEVDALMRELETGPYAYLRDLSPAALFERHRGAVVTGCIVLLFLLLNELRLHRLVARRSRELEAAMAGRERLAAEASAARLELAAYERRSIVEQMSGMIAHEINAPVGAIRTWAAVLRLRCPAAAFREEEPGRALLDATTRIDAEADRIAGIVSRVRAYARRELEPHAPVDLAAVMRRAAAALRAEGGTATGVVVRLADPPAPMNVLGSPLELEILALNLLRNAVRAVASDARAGLLNEPAVVAVGFSAASSGRRWRVRVENPGRRLEGTALERLQSRIAGMPGDAFRRNGGKSPGAGECDAPSAGLGLGLSICRGIADRHGASLSAEPRPSGGAVITLEMDALMENACRRQAAVNEPMNAGVPS